MTTLYNLRNDTLSYKGHVMWNFETLQQGPNVLTTAQRLAMTPTIGTMVYDSSMTTLYQFDGIYWVAIV